MMYTAVLMLAMTTAPETVDFGRRGGGCNTCYAGYGYSGCCGSRGYGGCYGGGYYGGCSGGGYYGGVGYGGGMYYAGGYPMSQPYYSGSTYAPGTVTSFYPPSNGFPNFRSPATIVVNVPSDARLTVDGSVTKSTGKQRTFVTPELDPGSSYVYTIRMMNGSDEKAAATREVVVRPGQTSFVNFDIPPQNIPNINQNDPSKLQKLPKGQ